MVYKPEEAEELDYINPSSLYCLRPEGKGTAFVESLSSYITRLAEAHHVKPGTLFSKILFPSLDKHYMNQIIVRGGNGFYENAHTMNGVTNTASELVKLIVQLTGCEDAKDMTLLRFKGVFPVRGLLKRNKTWCPVCFEWMRKSQQNIFEPLLWSFQTVTICLHHQVTLQDRCPNCSKNILQIERRSRTGYCAHCQNWLGHELPADVISDWEKAKWNLIAELLMKNTCFQPMDMLNSIKKLVTWVSNSNITEFSRRIGVPKTTFWTWHSGTNIPPLEDVLRICNKFGISLESFYTNNLVCEKLPVLPPHRIVKVNIHKTEKPLYEIGEMVRKFIRTGMTEPVPVSAMAKLMCCNKKTLYQHFNKNCKIQASRKKQYQSRSRKLRMQNQFHEIETSFNDVISQGNPSLHKVTKKLTKPGILREPEVRGKYYHLLFSHISTKYRDEEERNIKM